MKAELSVTYIPEKKNNNKTEINELWPTSGLTTASVAYLLTRTNAHCAVSLQREVQYKLVRLIKEMIGKSCSPGS
jgi:hypothetical protein